MKVALFNLVFKEKFMNARRYLTLLAAILTTAVQTLIFVADTAASAESVLASVAYVEPSSDGSSKV
jgi:hypothetical protein